jgi:condensin-2 complex subunit D3
MTFNETHTACSNREGQAAAAHVASEVFQKLVIAATAFATESDARTHYAGPDGTPIGKSGGKRRSILATPAPSSTPAQMPSTARRSELRRSSVGSPTPLKLKGRRMSDISNRSSPRNTTSQSGSLHPVLERVASMMQKLLTEPRNSASKVRTFTCAAVEKCLLKSTNKELIHFVLDWVIKISRSNADFHRLAAIRLCSFAVANESSLLVESAMRLDAEDGDETVVHSIVAAKLFDALRGRLLDMKQAVRVAAAKELITLFDVASDDDNRTLLRLLQVHAEDLVEVFRSLALEDSTITGKATFIKGLVSMLGLGEQLMLPITEADVGVLVVACQDSKSDTIRAVAADGLTSLLELATEDVMVSSLTNHWSQTVLPLVLDSQPKVQAKALQLVDQILLSPLVSEQDIQKRPSCRAWNCLSVISNRSVQPGSSKVEFEALRAAVAQRSDVADILVHCQYVGNLALEVDAEDVVTSGHEAGLWCLLCAILEHKDDISEISLLIKRNRKVKSGFDFAFRSFHELFDPSNLLRSPSIHQSARVYCLEVLGRLSFCLDLPFAGVRDHLVNLLSTFQLDAAYIAAAVRLFVASTICSSSHGDARTQSLSAIRGMLERCQHEILANAESASVDTRDTTSLSRALCSVGELCMAGFRVDDTCGKKDTATMISSLELDVRPSDKLSEAIFAISDSAIFAESIRGSALVVLGKMCLRDESLAHQCLSIFVRALSSEEGPIIRSNALLCMGDMIVRYTNLADRFVPEMATCLQAGISTGKGSTHVIVRKHAVLVLADLILQDYIKWRGLLFHRFLVACVDEDDEVALLAESMLCGPLKKGRLFASHFVESLFVFNGCDAHDMLKDRQGGVGTGADVSFGGIDFKGQQGQALRGKLYAIILSQLVDEDMIAATIGIAKDVVERCLQQGSELHRACVTSDKNDPAYNVLLDALTVLSSNAVRPRAAEASGDLDNTLKSEAAQLKVRGALLLKMSRKHLMESMLPLLVQLNEVLRINHSPLVQEVLNYFVVLLRLFPDEMGDNLSVKHPRLLSEVRFEAK